MGLDMMLYPVGEFTQVVHALNFADPRRPVLRRGAERGPGTIGRLPDQAAQGVRAAVRTDGRDHGRGAAFAALLNGVPIVTDQIVEGVPDKLVYPSRTGEHAADGHRAEGHQGEGGGRWTSRSPIGPAFEGETVRRPDTYIEAGGAAEDTGLRAAAGMRRRSRVEDGRITVIGKDVDQIAEGSVDPAGDRSWTSTARRCRRTSRSVMERRIHLFLNFAEGVWHTGQRNINWLRLSKNAVAAGFRFKHLGDILVTKMKEEFGNIVSRVQVTIITDEEEIKRQLPEAMEVYAKRDARMAGLTDEAVDTFYSCLMCQSFAPDHVCIITPERLGLCGAINWLDAKTGKEIVPHRPEPADIQGRDGGRGQRPVDGRQRRRCTISPTISWSGSTPTP